MRLSVASRASAQRKDLGFGFADANRRVTVD
jgi:hypothetical protein